MVVANGIVPFSLGTDTAGSGRVPAGHNNIVGLKPTKGWFSTIGLIPACRTIDVISIFALHIDDAWTVASLMQGYDETDEYSRMHPANVPTQFSKRKIAIPAQLEFYGDLESEKAFLVAVERVKNWAMKLRVLISARLMSLLLHCITMLGWLKEQSPLNV